MKKIERLYDGTLIDAQNITRSFKTANQTVDVLQGISLTIHAGEVVSLFGASGSGKTTLLNILGALDTPTSGTVTLCGEGLQTLSDSKRATLRRQHLGFIFQNYALVPSYSAAENIDLALRLPNLNIFERRRRVQAALEAVGLSAWADHLPAQLSGGQRQRIAIARALALRPAVVLADEPTSGLDTTTAHRILMLFSGIAKAQGTAFVIVSHDTTVRQYTDRAYFLNRGCLELTETNTAQGQTA